MGKRVYETSVRKDEMSEYRIFVEDIGEFFQVSQEDVENGEPWNITPIREFINLEEAQSYAQAIFEH